jgi:hypothetical protein
MVAATFFAPPDAVASGPDGGGGPRGAARSGIISSVAVSAFTVMAVICTAPVMPILRVLLPRAEGDAPAQPRGVDSRAIARSSGALEPRNRGRLIRLPQSSASGVSIRPDFHYPHLAENSEEAHNLLR